MLQQRTKEKSFKCILWSHIISLFYGGSFSFSIAGSISDMRAREKSSCSSSFVTSTWNYWARSFNGTRYGIFNMLKIPSYTSPPQFRQMMWWCWLSAWRIMRVWMEPTSTQLWKNGVPLQFGSSTVRYVIFDSGWGCSSLTEWCTMWGSFWTNSFCSRSSSSCG